MVCLLTPSPEFRDSFLQGIAEFERDGHTSFTYAPGLGYDATRLRSVFDDFVSDLLALAQNGRNRCADRVLWLVDGTEYVGQLSIRPELASVFLITYGGHIGYSVRPSRRRLGYGTRMLALGLTEARKMGLRRVLVTCNADNVASRRIIERNGGALERALEMSRQALLDEGLDPDIPRTKLRYWIELEHPSATDQGDTHASRCTCAAADAQH